MAETRTAVSLITSIVQLVKLGNKVVRRIQYFQTGAGEIPESLHHVTIELPILLFSIEQTKTMLDADSTSDEAKSALLSAIEVCRKQLEILEPLLCKILTLSGDSWRQKSQKAVFSLSQERQITVIMATIRKYVQALSFYHTASLNLQTRSG